MARGPARKTPPLIVRVALVRRSSPELDVVSLSGEPAQAGYLGPAGAAIDDIPLRFALQAQRLNFNVAP